MALRDAASTAAESALTAGINDSTHTIPCSPANLAVGDFLQIDSERMGPVESLGVSNVVIQTGGRGYSTSDPASHSIGSQVYVVVVAAQIPTLDEKAGLTNALGGPLSPSNGVVSVLGLAADLFDADDVGYDVVLLMGQSNMQGSGTTLDTTYYDTTDPRIYQFPSSGANAGKIVRAIDPLFHHQASTAVGPGMEFARQYVRSVHQNRSVLLIPCARGATGFTASGGYTWDVADVATAVNLYSLAVVQVTAALALNSNNRLVAALWHQGENDTPTLSQAQYATKLDALIDDLRTRFGSTLPFIVGQMTPDRIAEVGAGYNNVNAAHIDTPRRKVLTGFAYGPSGDVQSSTEKIHYNAVGARELGRRYFDQLVRFAPENVTGEDPVTPGAVTLTQTSGTALTAEWVRTPGRVTDYTVEYNQGAGWVTLSRSQSIDNTASITGLTALATVQVRVSAVNDEGTSAASATSSLTLSAVPGQVTGLAASAGGATSMALTWSTVTGAASYTVEYKATASGTWLEFDTGVTGLTSTVTGLSPSTSYDFRVSAVNGAGTGTASATATASTAAFSPLIDDVGVSAFTAYGLRKLRATYAGYAITIRRSSDSTTLDIGFDSNGALDTAAITTFVGANSAYVTKIYDQSGNGRDLSQATTAKQPRIVNSGTIDTKNSLPAMKFAATEWLAGTFGGLYAAGAASMIGVYTRASSAVTNPAYCEGANTSGARGRYVPAWWSTGGGPIMSITNDANTQFCAIAGANETQNGDLRSISVTDTGTVIRTTSNGVTVVAGNSYSRSGIVTVERTVLGGVTDSNTATPVALFDGYISEIVTFASALSAAQVTTADSNRMSYYALT